MLYLNWDFTDYSNLPVNFYFLFVQTTYILANNKFCCAEKSKQL